ncbi:MAG: hypothetical protein IPK18_01705 [Sphingobacteriales bacterium]|nr:MAG: hypothetical protein IPK18_01705 [Sphingobacteriales bacterium]
MKEYKPSLLDIDLSNKKLPVNTYALRVLDNNTDLIYDIIITHDGYCPNILDEREQSNYNDYLSNLENKVITEFFKTNGLKKPKSYSNLLEVMTNNFGELYHYSRISK